MQRLNAGSKEIVSIAEDCFNCGRSGHTASNCYKSQFERFTDRNQSRNSNQPADLRGRSSSRNRDRNKDCSSSRDHYRDQDRNHYLDRERDRDNDRDRERNRNRYDQSPSPYSRDRSRSRDSDRTQNPEKGSHFEPPSQPFRAIQNKQRGKLNRSS